MRLSRQGVKSQSHPPDQEAAGGSGSRRAPAAGGKGAPARGRLSLRRVHAPSPAPRVPAALPPPRPVDTTDEDDAFSLSLSDGE